MPAQMVFHEGGYEIIAVVVAGPAAKCQRDRSQCAGAFQQLGAELLGEKLVGISDIHQKVGEPCAILDQRNRVVASPCRLVVAKVSAQRLGALAAR